MANFIERLSQKVETKKSDLVHTLQFDASVNELALAQLVHRHWHQLPLAAAAARRPAFAVDGSRAVRHLANGAYLFVAQALIVGERAGERIEASDVDVSILPGATDAALIERSAGFLMHQLEVGLARQAIAQMPPRTTLFLDGALYGQLTSLYAWGDDAQTQLPPDIFDLPAAILDHYLQLFAACVQRDLIVISIAKTSHEKAHANVWWQAEHGGDLPKEKEISDSEAIYRWTERRAGFSTPILFGQSSVFRGARRSLLDSMQAAPAIVSFFVRLADFDDALRIDVPAACLGLGETIGAVEQERLLAPAFVAPILGLLAADYGGLEVYNALLYSVDREVRLRQEMMDQVYLNLIQDALGGQVEIRLDRSERRFHAR